MANAPNAVPVTVCMPIYNGALYIRDAIRSVLNQTVMPQEIIVSDSGSSDGSENIVLEEARQARTKLIILPTKTPGMVANWNSTIRAASGKYIKFLFQDDLLRADCLEEMVTVAESDERIGFVFSPRALLVEPSAEGDAIAHLLLRYQNLSAAFGELKTSQPGSLLLGSRELLQEPLNKIGEPTAVLVRTAFFAEVGLFNEKMHQLVDMEMWIRLMAVSHVGYISKALMSLRVHSQRQSNRQTDEIIRFDQDCLCETLRKPTVYQLLHWEVRRALRSRARLGGYTAASPASAMKLTQKLQVLAQFSTKEKIYIVIRALLGRLWTQVITQLNRLLAKVPPDQEEAKMFFAKLIAAGHHINKIKSTNLVNIRSKAALGDYRFLLRRGTSDVQAAQLVLIEKEYQPLIDLIFRECQEESIEYIVDAGAYVGYATIFFKKMFPQSVCFAVEPDADNYTLLLENIRLNNLGNVFPVKAALWSSSTALTIGRSFRDGKEWSISVAEAGNGDIETAQGITVSKFVHDYAIPRIDLFKMDVEGAEAFIFSRDAQPEQFLCKVKFLALEIHNETEARELILDMLRESEFEISFHGETLFGVNRKLR